MIGKRISHYEIAGKLGEGGMGAVYAARDTKLERTVALKFLHSGTIGGAVDLARFVREAQAAAALHHPSICKSSSTSGVTPTRITNPLKTPEKRTPPGHLRLD